MRSASRPGSSMLVAMTMTSGEMFLPRLADFSSARLDVAHQGLELEALLRGLAAPSIGSMRACRYGWPVLEGRDARAADALHEDADAPVGQLQHAHDEGDRADGEEVVGPGVLVVLPLLRGEQDHAVLGQGLVHGLDRALAAHVERHDHEREDDDVPQRQDGQVVGDLGGLRRPCAASSLTMLLLRSRTTGIDDLPAAPVLEPRQA